MIIKRVSDYEPFKAVDNSEIVEVIGIPNYQHERSEPRFSQDKARIKDC
ncbi:MAG: hypothetical protein ACPLY9_06340 [Nitrososphaerales archaeon]